MIQSSKQWRRNTSAASCNSIHNWSCSRIVFFTHFGEKSPSLTQEEAQQWGLEIYWLFWCYLTSSHLMEANSVMGLFCKLITARVDYSLSALGRRVMQQYSQLHKVTHKDLKENNKIKRKYVDSHHLLVKGQEKWWSYLKQHSHFYMLQTYLQIH